MKCEAIGCEKEACFPGGFPPLVFCVACGTKRMHAAADAFDKWDREHRKPKELVIEVDVPKELLGNDVLRASYGDGWGFWLRDPSKPCQLLGHIVLKARRETP